MLSAALATLVATIYTPRGDTEHDSTAKYAYSETKEQELARRLVNGSEHLGQDNIEVLANSVSASSHKLTAYNTISRAIETSWKGGPVTTADLEAQSSWLISAWDSLVKVRPEYGKLSTPARQAQRKNTIATSAVAIYGLVGAMSAMYTDHVEPDVAFKAIAAKDDDDFFAWDNPVWVAAGIVTPSGTGTGALGTRNSFPARRAAIRVLCEAMNLGADEDE